MTRKQEVFYWRCWGPVRKVYREQGMSPAQADAMRKELHRQIGAVYPKNHAEAGQPKSHLDMSSVGKDDDLSRFIAKCAAIADSGNLKPQMKFVNQTAIKSRYKATQLMDQLGISTAGQEAYLNGVAENSAGMKLMYVVKAADWRKVIGALTRTVKYQDKEKQWPQRPRAEHLAKPAKAAPPPVIYMQPSSPDDIDNGASDAIFEPSQASGGHGGEVDENNPF